MPFASINGDRVYYESHGGGDAVVLLHHGFGSSKIWKDIYLNLAACGYRVVMYDRRGYGKSEKGSDFEKFYVSDAFRPENVEELALFMRKLGIENFHIIGQCEGGVLGVDYAAKYPEEIKTLIISSTQCYSRVTMAEFNKLKFPHPFHQLEEEIKEKFVGWHGEERAEWAYELFRRYGGEYGRGIFDIRGVLPRVMCPTLVIYPDRSALFDVEQGVEFYRHLPQGALAVIPNCGHNTYENHPEKYLRLCLDFLKQHIRPQDKPITISGTCLA
jgi:pimeloyl-ACP methyl ester carboxylesterase